MKYVQYVTGEGVSSYIPSDLIIRITDEGADSAKVLIGNDGEEVVLHIKSLELIDKLNADDGENVIFTEKIITQEENEERARKIREFAFNKWSLQIGGQSDEEDDDNDPVLPAS